MVYTLLDTQHLVALHAACVAKDGRGFLLVGPSGAGKSSLAYACMCRGWTYVSDDASSLLRRRPGRIVVGNPYAFRFHPAASSLFPELRRQVKSRNGKPTVEITTEQFVAAKLGWQCTVDYVVFLDRREQEVAEPQLTLVPKDAALRWIFQQNIWPLKLPGDEQRLEAIERLLEAETFLLTYKAFDPAIQLLEQIARVGAA